ncbi:hypothetical protein N7476_004638 [Penicillium atrosanguineum]|uniref:Uncharacterized protein n=1 Tax=Penicillium atrosanguineum TaxID=1132637 RepID=A0A9W9PXT6_9EURO|nr:hypothetical protein N7526_001900 [Penicillium atrosanguineum]KAJ5318218.1 hypothetical protein N7476_004638 [Penicillium atrosanguineum]
MHPASTALILVLSFAFLQFPITAQTIPYYHMWADTTGTTHVSACNLTNFELQLLSTGDSPQYLDTVTSTPSNSTSSSNSSFTSTVKFTVQPSGWHAGWHKNPKVQFIIALKGTWEVHMTDGSVAIMEPGDMALGEDQFASPAPGEGEYAGLIGHNASNVGDEVNAMLWL